MRIRNVYAVVATENDPSDFKAIFADESHAEHYAKFNGDPYFENCDYRVVRISLDANSIEVNSP